MLTIGEIETLIECIESFGEYFDDSEVLDSAKLKLETMRSKITSSNSEYKSAIINWYKEYRHQLSEQALADLSDCLNQLR